MKRSLLIHIYIVIFSSVCLQQMPRWHNSKRLLQQTPYASAYWLALQEERFIPYSDTLPYGTRTIHVALTPSSITACSTSTPLTSSSVCLGRNGLSTWSNRLWAFRRRIQLSGTRCLATNVKPNRRGKERLIALLTENYRPENRVYRYNFSTTIVPPARGTR